MRSNVCDRPVALNRFLVAVRRLALGMLFCGLVAAGWGQGGPKQGDAPTASQVEVYAGYAYFHPFESKLGGLSYETVDNQNITASFSGYLWRRFGVQAEGAYLSGGAPRGTPGQCDPACSTGDPTYYTAEVGPVYRFRDGRFLPFVHLLGGGARASGPLRQPLRWGQGVTGGGGADYVLPFFGDHLALRGQADYEFLHIRFEPGINDNVYGGVGDINVFKLSGGFVVRLGSQTPLLPVELACAVEPEAVFPGDPARVTATATHLNSKRMATYTWEGNGISVDGSGASAAIVTEGLAGGSYAIVGRVSQGAKPYQQASCTATLVVKDFEPPTVTCSANPASLVIGESATIAAKAVSPQNRPLTYRFSASAGQISQAGRSATLITAGLSPAAVQVTCDVADDVGNTASAATEVTVASPPLPPAKPAAEQICSIAFVNDEDHPVRVDEEAKLCLDEIAVAMQQTPDAKLVIVGNRSPGEALDRAEVRALNERAYLMTERGVDGRRIELRTDGEIGRTVDNLLMRPGTLVDAPGTVVVDPASIKPEGPAYVIAPVQVPGQGGSSRQQGKPEE